MRCREASLTRLWKSSSLFRLLGFGSGHRLSGGNLLRIQFLLMFHRHSVLLMHTAHLGLVGHSGALHFCFVLLLRANCFSALVRERDTLVVVVLLQLLVL